MYPGSWRSPLGTQNIRATGAPAGTAHRLVAVPHDARSHEPARVNDAAGKIPPTLDAIAAVDRACAPLRTDRAGQRTSAGIPRLPRPTSASSHALKLETAVAIIVHQPMEPSAREMSSMARKTTSGGSSGPPIERGRYICRRPASASASTMGEGTWRSASHSSRGRPAEPGLWHAATTRLAFDSRSHRRWR